MKFHSLTLVVLLSFLSLKLYDRPVCAWMTTCPGFTYTFETHISLDLPTEWDFVSVLADVRVFGRPSTKEAGHIDPIMFSGGGGLSFNWRSWALRMYGNSDHYVAEPQPGYTGTKPTRRMFNYVELRKSF